MHNETQKSTWDNWRNGLIFALAVTFAIHVATLEWHDRTLPVYDVKLTQDGLYKVEYSAGRYQNETVNYMVLGGQSVYSSNNTKLVILRGSSAIFPKWNLYYNESYWKENHERKRRFLASVGVFPED